MLLYGSTCLGPGHNCGTGQDSFFKRKDINGQFSFCMRLERSFMKMMNENYIFLYNFHV